MGQFKHPNVVHLCGSVTEGDSVSLPCVCACGSRGDGVREGWGQAACLCND